MKLGILSDTHNEIANTHAALAVFQSRQVRKLLHCGDVTRPKMIQLFEGWDIALVYGNIDRDRTGLANAVAQTAGPYQIGVVCELAVNGTRIGVCHGHDEELLAAIIESGIYDLVFHGHSHSRRDERLGSTRVINPGALGGRYPESRSVCIFDLFTQTVEFIYV
jgi:hypothetical protein